jgi:hypothetical protein
MDETLTRERELEMVTPSRGLRFKSPNMPKETWVLVRDYILKNVTKVDGKWEYPAGMNDAKVAALPEHPGATKHSVASVRRTYRKGQLRAQRLYEPIPPPSPPALPPPTYLDDPTFAAAEAWMQQTTRHLEALTETVAAISTKVHAPHSHRLVFDDVFKEQLKIMMVAALDEWSGPQR